MVKCEICGKKTENPKDFGLKKLCEDCYEEIVRDYYGGCGCGCRWR
ncbi:MAG: hypothetical protein N2V75_06375 [Methanophagales archaeon]|nr:hypothetical protein [Methanophagales archaeon]